MNRKNIIAFGAIALLTTFMSIPVFGQNVNALVRKGNKEFDKGKYSDAEVLYRKALAKNPKFEKAIYNLGDALYKEKNYDEAAKDFLNAAKTSKSNMLKAKSWYNLGNTFMQKKQYEQSISAYIQSLRLNPNDYNAKYNLEYARKKLKNQQQKNKNKKNNKNKNNKNQNKQNKNNQNKNNQNKNKQSKNNQNKNKQNKNNQNKNNQNKNNQNKNNQNKQQQNKQQQNSGSPKMTKAEAQRMLDALRNNEKGTLKKLEKKKAKAIKGKPDVINW